MKIVKAATVFLIQSLDLFGRLIVGYRRRLVKSIALTIRSLDPSLFAQLIPTYKNLGGS